MKVGVPKEVKNHEYRVAITPAGVHELVRAGHEVYVQQNAGTGSSIPDEDFVAAGATILPSADDVWQIGELVLKVKEPVAEEYHRMRKDQVLFTYLHLAASRSMHGRAAGVRHHRDRVRDRPAARWLATAAGADVRGSRADGTAGRRTPPAAGRRRPGRSDGRRIRRLRGEGCRARGRRVRHERSSDLPGHAGRGAAGRQEHRPAAPGRRHLPGPLPDRRVERSTRSSAR